MIPVNKTDSFSVDGNNLFVAVYEGESAHTDGCQFLDAFTLLGISPTSQGPPQIDITFDLDANRMLEVSARDSSTGKSTSKCIVPHNALGKIEITRMMHIIRGYEGM